MERHVQFAKIRKILAICRHVSVAEIIPTRRHGVLVWQELSLVK